MKPTDRGRLPRTGSVSSSSTRPWLSGVFCSALSFSARLSFSAALLSGAAVLVGCGAPLAFAPSPSPTPSPIIASPTGSTGCSKPSPVALGTSVNQTVLSGALNREYLIHVPSGYRAGSETPLVLDFHGHSSNASQQEERSGLSDVADQQGFIVVYPQGVREADGETGWATTASRAARVDDVLFVGDLLDKLQGQFCIDPRRIYATGFSNGGGMTNLLACTMATRIAAIAPVAGAFPPDPYPGGCRPDRPVPVLELHGTEDLIVPYDGRAGTHDPSILEWLAEWAARDGCTAGPETFYEQGTVTGIEWTGCKNNSAVVHYRISKAGHVWPSNVTIETGGAAHERISTPLLIWKFFQQHILPGKNVQSPRAPARRDRPASAMLRAPTA